MKKKTIDKRKISKECWNLDYHFLEWLKIRLPIYLREASKIVDLSYHKFEYEGETKTQEELIKEMIRCLKLLEGMDTWDKEYYILCDKILRIWYLVFHTMWW